MHFMETTLAVAFGSFLAGWFSRDFTASRVSESVTKCVCDCNWQGSTVVSDSGHQLSSGTWFIGGLLVVLIIAIFSNVAVALRVSLKDLATGADKEFTVSVKGKSKGFYGPAAPLRIAG